MPTTTSTTLDQKTIETIKSTVPVIAEHGDVITKRFYELLFSNHPELLNIFNHANQKQGRQSKALANAIYAAAQYIDRLEEILPAVKQIAHKHRSLEIKPEHYPIVGENLLLAIKDVLGDAATDEIIEAWGKAYQIIAQAFIGVEQAMYKEAATQKGGWNGFRAFVVDRRIKESDVITSFYLKAEDGLPISDYKPGQYISVRCPHIDGEKNTHIRQYSLSDAPGKGYYRISVKRETAIEKPDGIVSNYLYDHVQQGDVLEITAPAGDFILNMEQSSPVVLISGGVGLTPMISMLNTLVEKQPERKVTFIHAALNSKLHAMHDHVLECSRQNENIDYYVCYQNPTDEDRKEKRFDKEGFIDLVWLQSILSDNHADFYFCGPVPFMKAVNHALKDWGVPDERIHFEFFGPAEILS